MASGREKQEIKGVRVKFNEEDDKRPLFPEAPGERMPIDIRLLFCGRSVQKRLEVCVSLSGRGLDVGFFSSRRVAPSKRSTVQKEPSYLPLSECVTNIVDKDDGIFQCGAGCPLRVRVPGSGARAPAHASIKVPEAEQAAEQGLDVIQRS